MFMNKEYKDIYIDYGSNCVWFSIKIKNVKGEV